MSSLGSSKINGPLIANGGASFSNDNFVIDINTADTYIKGNVNMYNNLIVQNNLSLQGNFNVSSGMFTIQEITGDTYIAGELTINKQLIIKNTLSLLNSSNNTIVEFNTSGFSYILGGNLGIGTIEPDYKLDVSGNINVSKNNTYKIDGVDVIFSQWENINGNIDILYPSSKGKVYIGYQTAPNNASYTSLLNINGDITLDNSHTLIVMGVTLETYIIGLIPKNVWDNSPIGATVESKTIESISTNYSVQIAETLAIGNDIDSNYRLSLTGNLNIQNGDIYFDGNKFDYNLWRIGNNTQSTNNTKEKTIYFSTTDIDEPTPGVNYVGIGTNAPGYHLDVNGHVNVRGNLSINGVSVIFPSREDGTISTSTWMESTSEDRDKISLYYGNGNSGDIAGNVGIGISNPTSLLTLYGNIDDNSSILEMTGRSYASYIQFSRNESTPICQVGFTQNNNTLNIINQLGDGSINISNSTGTGRIFMDNTGNIGIGTQTTNNCKLYVQGKICSIDNLTIKGTDINLTNGNSVGNINDTVMRSALRHAPGDILEVDPDQLYNGGIKCCGTLCIVPTDDSNSNYHVGIGISTPQSSLDVNGNINYSGNVTRNGIVQESSQWASGNYDQTDKYIYYPDSSNLNDYIGVGIGTTATPNATLEILDPRSYESFVYRPQLMLTSIIDNYKGSNKGTSIELNTIDKSTVKSYKGIRLHTVNDAPDNATLELGNYTGFAIDTGNGTTTNQFTNMFYMNSFGNLGIGNFLNIEDMRIPDAKMHILNTDNTQPSLIIGDINQSISNLTIINSNNNEKNLGFFSNIIGVNIQSSIGDNNQLKQKEVAVNSNGAVAINLSAGGGNGGLINSSAMGVLLTNTNADDEILEEKFTISYEGNIGIRTVAPPYGISLTHSNSDTDGSKLVTGSINIDGYYYKNGKKLHLPWIYLISNDGDYGEPSGGFPIFYFDESYALGGDPVSVPPQWQPDNNINQIDSVVGIGTTQPRGALDVRGTFYSSYVTLSSRKITKPWLSLYHSRFESQEIDTTGTNPKYFSYIMKDNGHTRINSLINEVDKTAISFENFGDTKKYAEIINNETEFDSIFYMYGRCEIANDLKVSGNCEIINNLTVHGTVNFDTDDFKLKGDLHVDGSVYAVAFYTHSDLRLKENIIPINNALEKVNKMQGVYFNMKTDKSAKMIGLIAQDVEKIIPELVSETDDDEKIKNVSYGNITAVLIEAVKELTQQNKELQKRIEILENK